MGIFERYLSLWVWLCILAGVSFRYFAPALFSLIASIEYANVHLVVSLLILIIIYPMMVGKKPKGLCVTLVVNWLI